MGVALGLASYVTWDKPLNCPGLFLHLQNIGVEIKFEAPGLFSVFKQGLSDLIPLAVTHRIPIPCSTLTESLRNAWEWGTGHVVRARGLSYVHRDQSPYPDSGRKQTSLLATLSCGCVFPFASSSPRRSSLFPTSWNLETLTSQLIFSHLPLEQGCWPCAFPRPVPVPGGSVGPEVTSEREGAHPRAIG